MKNDRRVNQRRSAAHGACLLAALVGCMCLATRAAQAEESIFLAGDAGDLSSDVAAAVLAQGRLTPHARKFLVLLGDNIYPLGLPDPADRSYPEALERLERQIKLAEDLNARVVFIPGNHDWANHGLSQKATMLRQAEFLNKRLGPATLVPADACAGPVEVRPGEQFRVLAVDSQWLTHTYPKRPEGDGSCSDLQSFYKTLADMLTQGNRKPFTIYAQHHTIISGTEQPPDYPKDELLRILDSSKPLICASGHEHTLQVIKGRRGCRYYLISGAMSYVSDRKDKEVAAEDGELLFRKRSLGFMRLDVSDAGSVKLRVFSADKKSHPAGRLEFERLL